MTLGRQIFESTMSKILLPWINLGFTAAMVALGAEMLENLRSYLNT
jgi:hypothetical protein